MTPLHDLPPLPAIWYDQFSQRCGINVCEEARSYAIAAIAPYKARIKTLEETQRKYGLHQEGLFKRAEKAEAENAKLRELLAKARAFVNDHPGALAGKFLARIDAALGEKK
jgi:hypothetical protein